MGVFGAFFGCSGDVGFKGPLLAVCSGVVGFNVAMLSRLVRDILRHAPVLDAARRTSGGCDGGFAPCEAL